MKRFKAIPGKGIVASKVIMSTQSSNLNIDSVSEQFQSYISRQPHVEDVAVDVDDTYFYITISFDNGEMIDAWDELIDNLGTNNYDALHYLRNKYAKMFARIYN